MSNSIIQTGQKKLVGSTSTNVSPIMRAVKSKMFEQLCLLVLDGSGSMSWDLDGERTKADATRNAILDLVKSLKKSTKSEGFHLAIITYAKVPEVKLFSQQVKYVIESEIDLGEEFGEGPATRIDLALRKAEELASAFINSKPNNSRLDRTVRILLMSDGYCNEPDNSRINAAAIKERHADIVRICCCLLSQPEEESFEYAEALMKDIASEISGGKLCYTNAIGANELRAFFERSSTED